MKTDNLTASEALYEFAGMLTTLKEPIEIGSTKDAYTIDKLVQKFISRHNLDEPRPEWYRK